MVPVQQSEVQIHQFPLTFSRPSRLCSPSISVPSTLDGPDDGAIAELTIQCASHSYVMRTVAVGKRRISNLDLHA